MPATQLREKFAFGFGRSLFPGNFYGAIGRKETDEIISFAVRAGSAGEIEFGVFGETFEGDGLKGALGDVKLDGFPAVTFVDGGIEFDLDGEFAGFIEIEDEAIRFGADVPFWVRAEFGEGDGAGDEFEGTAG